MSLSFTYFSKLPPELRLKIFFHALPGPRMIRMQTEITSDGQSAYTDVLCSSTTLLNAIYLTCKESHNVLKSHYQLPFANRPDFLRPIWFDPEIDTLYFSDWIALDNFTVPEDWNPTHGDPDTQSVKNIAIPLPHGVWDRPEGILTQLKALTPDHCQVCCFGHLSELKFVLNQPIKDGDSKWFLETFNKEMRDIDAGSERKGHESRVVEGWNISFVDQSDLPEASSHSQDS